MNDRFRFRAWIGIDKKMRYDIENDYDSRDGLECFGFYLDDSYKCQDIKVMQCTGLKDKNGKLIYEGDIVHVTGDYGYNEMDNEPYHHDWAYEIKDIRELASEWGLMNAIDAEFDVEIIGNIYENPEMMK